MSLRPVTSLITQRFQRWLTRMPVQPLVAVASHLLSVSFGCLSCHVECWWDLMRELAVVAEMCVVLTEPDCYRRSSVGLMPGMVLQVCRTHMLSPMCEARAASLRRLAAGGRAVASRLRHVQALSLEALAATALHWTSHRSIRQHARVKQEASQATAV